MSPFSIRETLLAKNAQHCGVNPLPHRPVLDGSGVRLHRAVGEAPCSRSGSLLQFPRGRNFDAVGRRDGLLAWQFQLEGQRLKGILLQHLVLGVVSSLMIGLVWYVHFRARRAPEQALPRYCLAIELLAMGLVAMTAHLGGYLSGVNIPG